MKDLRLVEALVPAARGYATDSMLETAAGRATGCERGVRGGRGRQRERRMGESWLLSAADIYQS